MVFPVLFRDVLIQSKIQVRAAAAAWVQITRVPASKRLTRCIDQHALSARQIVRYLPFCYLIIGLLGVLLYLAIDNLTGSKALASLAAVTLSLPITNETTPKHTLFSVILLLTTWQLLIDLPNHIIMGSLIAANAFACFASMSFLYTHKPMHPVITDAESYPGLPRASLYDVDFVVMAICGMLPVILLGQPLFIAILPCLWILRGTFCVYLTRHPEAYTSATLHAFQQAMSLGFYFGAVIIVHFATHL